MKLIDLQPKLCEELIETILHFVGDDKSASEIIVYRAIDKTPSYLKKPLNLLIELQIVKAFDEKFKILENYFCLMEQPPRNILMKGFRDFKPLQEYEVLIRQGKPVNKAAKLLKATWNIENDLSSTIGILNKYKKYLESDVIASNKVESFRDRIGKSVFWIDSNGQLQYDESTYAKEIIERIETMRFKNPAFVDQSRIESLKKISCPDFDLSKLIRLCEEINEAYRIGNYFSVGVLVRAILDHIPPIFGKKTFSEVANNHGSRSFKDVMGNLEIFNRKIADGILHTHIRRKEFLPNSTSVDCRSGIDLLLSEIINQIN